MLNVIVLSVVAPARRQTLSLKLLLWFCFFVRRYTTFSHVCGERKKERLCGRIGRHGERERERGRKREGERERGGIEIVSGHCTAADKAVFERSSHSQCLFLSLSLTRPLTDIFKGFSLFLSQTHTHTHSLSRVHMHTHTQTRTQTLFPWHTHTHTHTSIWAQKTSAAFVSI